ncbi:hypothetical protein FB45DRAFT_230222 [Roridomyces roridus]|uniref:F-box domain-containing protein n=1 Tax=Roridomyces roridus TaxID=1738132 RepID=A0AAD7FF07_9AGAR|nr:hypothetical protein FB45DRAFT_230222 [Roridomyces roridus]
MTTTSADSPPHSIATHRDELNRVIAFHYAQISILKAQVNALSAISALPNELIAKIFRFYAFLDRPPFDLKWTKVMLVCRRWHDIAVAEQWLWSFVKESLSSYNFKSMQQIITQLDRSGAAPLTLDVKSINADFDPHTLLQHAERIRDLEISGEAMYVIQFTHSLSTHQLPLLRNVKLDSTYKWDVIPEDSPNALPDALFDGRAPHLIELDLRQAPLNWSLLCGLTKLSLESAPDTVQPPLSILSVLEASPALTDLKLNLVLTSGMFIATRPAVTLPLLEFVWIREPVELCTELLRHLVIPPTTRLAVYGLGIDTGRDIGELLVLVRKHIRQPASPAIRCLQLDSKATGTPPGTHLRISALTATTLPDPLSDEQSASFTVNTHPQTSNALRQILNKVFKTLPYTAITHFDTSGATNFSVTSWKAAFALLPALEMIYSFAGKGPGVVTMFDALRALTQTPQTSTSAPSDGFLPHLRHIHMRAYVWRERGSEEDPVAGLWDALERLVDARIAAGSKLAVLEIDERGEGLNLSDAQLQVLFDRVGQLIRDGHDYDPVAFRKMREG